jgi:hypothetical protein
MWRGLLVGMAMCLVEVCWAQSFEIHVPKAVVAGEEATISTGGSGKATFYLAGPGVSRKADVGVGGDIHLSSQEVRNAGAYVAVLCSDSCRSATFYVTPAKPASLTFLVHPSRVPAGQGDAVTGVLLPFDQFRNLVLAPAAVDFQLTAGNTPILSRTESTHDGVAWFRTASGKSAGALQVIATADNLSARRVVQQVASDPCNLRIKGQRNAAGILVETDPVHDCSGNPVPDGTIVSFTATDAEGKSTVDAPVKQGIARAQISASGDTVISVASGVVMGNELRIGGQR